MVPEKGDPYISGMSTCKLCRNEATLIKAHVIPRSFWEINASQPAPRMVTNTEGVFSKKVPIGVYDQTIVCEPCERSFRDYDNYAAHLFFNRFHEFEEVRDNTGRLIAYVFSKAWDYSLLKLFAVAVLWRASVSSHSFFNRIRLGAFEEKAREMLLRRDSGDRETFATLFSVWDDADPFMMDPCAGRWDGGVRYYRFYLGRFVAYIKVDNRALPEPLAKAALRPGGPIAVVSRQFAASQELRVAEQVFAHHAKHRREVQKKKSPN